MKINVAVFFGGKSTEHEVSCISANQAIHALDEEKYNVVPVYITRDNEFFSGEKLFDLANYADFIDNPASVLDKVYFYKDGNKVIMKPVKQSLFKKEETQIDIAFPVVHGTNVEDGSLAGFLQMLDLPYTSCDVLGGAVGQDKAVMKAILKNENLPMVDYLVVYGYDFDKCYDEYFAKAEKIGFPLIAKPANLGSSIGIEIIKSAEEFKEKISECLKYDFKVVVEQMVTELQEVNISVMGSIDKHELSVIEDVTVDEFYDFSTKYESGSKGTKGSKSSKNISKTSSGKLSQGMVSSGRKVPAEISEEQENTIREVASKAFVALNAHGCVRIDFMIDKSTGDVYINEINTIPGSLAFYLWEAKGVSFKEECDILIRNALLRYSQKEKKTYSFNTQILNNYRRK